MPVISIVSKFKRPTERKYGEPLREIGIQQRFTGPSALSNISAPKFKPIRFPRCGIRKPTETQGPKNPREDRGLSVDLGGHRHLSDQDKGEPEVLVSNQAKGPEVWL